MAKFPITYGTGALTREPSLPRAQIDVRTGEEQIGQAMGELGGALFEIGQKIENAENAMELSTFQRQSDETWNAAYDTILTTPDPEARQEIFIKATQDASALKSKRDKVNNAYQMYLNDTIPRWQASFNTVDRNMRIQSARDQLEINGQAALETGDLQKYYKDLSLGLSTGLITKVEHDAKVKSAPVDSVLAQARIAIGSQDPIQIQMAIDGLNGLKDLSGEQLNYRDSLLQRAETTIRRIETQAKIAQDEKDEEIGGAFLKLLINKLEPDKEQLTFDMIVNSDLSFEAKDEWFTKLRTFDNYSDEELREAFTDKGEVIADIYDKIDNGTLTDELDTMVGKGLSPVTAERIKKEIRVPYEQQTEELFRRIFGWSPELGFPDNMSAWLYEKGLREWQAEVKRQDATGEQIVEIGRAIIRPYFIEKITKEIPYEDIPRIVELALGEPGKVEEEIEEEKPEKEKVELYEIGETRTDETGQIWEFIGDNKWRKK